MNFDKALFDRRLKFIVVMLSIGIIGYVVARMAGCGSVEPPKQKETPRIDCGEVPLGGTKQTECNDGKNKKIETCTEQGLVVSLDCPVNNQCGKVTFAEVKPLIDTNCKSCHEGYANYGTAKALAGQMINRINATNPALRMPKDRPPLSDNEKQIFSKWQQDGLLENCGNQRVDNFETFYQFASIEQAIEASLRDLSKEDKEDSRFLLLTHIVDEFLPKDRLSVGIAASNKAINSIAAKASRLGQLTPLGPEQSVLRILLRDFELTKNDWKLITQADEMKFESFTNLGLLIKFLTQENRPFMHFDNFIDVTFRNSELYYKLQGAPATFDELTRLLGVDYKADLANFRAMLIGTNESPISLQKNRLISRHESVDGAFWATYDIVQLGGKRERNLSEFPLLADTGGQAVFQFDASEAIYTMKNGMLGFWLSDARGRRQNAAPTNIVQDVISPISAEIRNANSCSRCHNSGIIIAQDEIKEHVRLNRSAFRRVDFEIVEQIYRDNEENARVISGDNEDFAAALNRIGVATDVDPMNQATDVLLLNWDVKKTAAYLFLPPEEFIACVAGSEDARRQVGQLLSGGSISRDQFVTILPILKEECRLFQEPLGR